MCVCVCVYICVFVCMCCKLRREMKRNENDGWKGRKGIYQEYEWQGTAPWESRMMGEEGE